MIKRVGTIVAAAFVIIQIGCAKRSLVRYEDVEAKNDIKLKLNNGEVIQGTVCEINADSLTLIMKHRNRPLRIPQQDIVKIERKPPVYDESGEIITEKEIEKHKGHGNFLLYSFGGGALSFGISFFLGSLVQRASHDGNVAFIPVTAGGTILGTSLFAWWGWRRDRLQAIERIREQRKDETLIKLQQEQQKQKEVKEETEKIKAQRKKLEEEKRRLIEELQKKQK